MIRVDAIFWGTLSLFLFNGCSAEEVKPVPDKVKADEHGVKGDGEKGAGGVKKHKHTNRLAKETSPYLLQHAHNPVDWYPWGPEAFAKAKKEDKPIFLSVGYSACHWCHVMERESFEHEDVGEYLNKNYICIKVDREERPDVDDIYMKYVHLMQQSGGWPMSIVMTPDAAPFFGGTYFPKVQFLARMKFLRTAWDENRKKIEEHCQQIVVALRERANAQYRAPDRPLTLQTVGRAVVMGNEYFDFEEGGMKGRRKFPPHTMLDLFVDLSQKGTQSKDAAKMVRLCLDKMQRGGIHDQVGGGFHRYTVDHIWLVPHFEKMLYDNAQLARVYTKAAVAFKDASYARTARGILDWTLREMTSKDGVFYSAYDADSDGKEGVFYVWAFDEVEKILGADAAAYCEMFNVQKAGNFKEESTGHPTGTNIPHLSVSIEAYAKAKGLKLEDQLAKVDAWNKKLLAVRIKRIWPGLDNKVLTSWNGLMIGSFALAGKLLNEPRYLDAAVKAGDWFLKNMRMPDGRWYATHNYGKSKLAAYLDDHAYMANAFLDLYDVTKDKRWLLEAEKLVAILDAHFWDEKSGGYFFVADDHQKLLVRVKNPNDNATPAGNGIMAQVLARLALATNKNEYDLRLSRLLKAFHVLMDLAPVQVESMLLGLKIYLESGRSLKDVNVVEISSRVKRGPVLAELILGSDKLRVGTKVPVLVKLTVEKGWHVQASKPSSDKLFATKIGMEAVGGILLEGVKYPAVEKLKIDPALKLGEELHVYGGELVIGGFVSVPENGTLGEQNLTFSVHFQACDDKKCLLPEKVTLTLKTEVVSKDAVVKEIRRKFFESKGLWE